MTQPILIIYFLSLALFVNAIPFDFFQLVQQWGPNVCNDAPVSSCYSSPKPMFTIHGLWPSNYTNVQLICNSNRRFVEVKSLEAELDIYWPNIKYGNNSEFWRYEWNKHGKCSSTSFNVYDYFDIALKLRKEFDLLAILNAAGLNPQISKDLVFHDIITPIQKTTNKKPGIRCNKNGKTGKLQLYEIVLCSKKDGKTLIDCPSFVSSSCQTKFAWLLPQENSIGVLDYP